MIGALPLAAIPPEDEALRPAIRDFLRETVAGIPPERRARSWMGFDEAFSRELAERGWLGLTFPKAYGGAGRGAFARYVLVEELLAAGAPVSAHWIADRQSAKGVAGWSGLAVAGQATRSARRSRRKDRMPALLARDRQPGAENSRIGPARHG